MEKMIAAAKILDSSIPGVRAVLSSRDQRRGRITVLSDNPSQSYRSDILSRVESCLVGEVSRRSGGHRSSIGHLEGDGWYVVVKPSRITGEGFSVVRRGADNERNLLLVVKHVLSLHEDSITVTFVGSNSTYSVKGVSSVKAGSTGKGDVLLTTDTGKECAVSVKQGDSFKWDSGERRFEPQFRKMVRDIVNSKRFDLRPPSSPGEVWRISPAAVRKMPQSEAHVAVFGSSADLGVVVVQRFSPSNFTFDAETGVLSVSVQRCYSLVSQLPDSLKPVFLIRNDNSRNTYSGEFRGLRFEISPMKVDRKHLVI